MSSLDKDLKLVCSVYKGKSSTTLEYLARYDLGSTKFKEIFNSYSLAAEIEQKIKRSFEVEGAGKHEISFQDEAGFFKIVTKKQRVPEPSYRQTNARKANFAKMQLEGIIAQLKQLDSQASVGDFLLIDSMCDDRIIPALIELTEKVQVVSINEVNDFILDPENTEAIVKTVESKTCSSRMSKILTWKYLNKQRREFEVKAKSNASKPPANLYPEPKRK